MRNVRDLDISTSNSGFSVDELEGRRNHTPDDTVSRRSTTQKARCMPSYSETYSFWHKGRWMTVYAVRYEDSLSLRITCVSSSYSLYCFVEWMGMGNLRLS